MPGPQVWKIELAVPGAAAEVFAAALEPLAPTVAMFEISQTDYWRIEGYTPVPPEHDRLVAAVALASGEAGIAEPSVICLPLPDRDWVAETQRAAQPIAAGRFFVHGSHHAGTAPAGSWPIEIDAGLAFGTGDHATTMGCLVALSELARRRRFMAPLDLGSGSGILAIAMARAWRCRVTASDVDPDAVRVTAENARRNGVAGSVRALAGAGLAGVALRRCGPFDLIVANILARPLRSMATDLRRSLAPGGVVILSGILDSQESMVLTAYRSQGLALRKRIGSLGWRTLVLAQAGAKAEKDGPAVGGSAGPSRRDQ